MELLKSFLLEQGFQNLLSDNCLFFKYVDDLIVLILVFVDDMLLACKDERLLDELVEAFSRKFNIKDTGEVELYFSINIKLVYE